MLQYPQMSEESDIQAELDSLPKGTIVRRTIRGTDRFYHQWRENGVTKSRYLSPGEIMPLRAQLERRHELLSFGSISQKMKQSSKTRNRTFQCDVLTGRFLAEYAASVGHDKKRDCYFTLFNITRQQTGSVPSLSHSHGIPNLCSSNRQRRPPLPPCRCFRYREFWSLGVLGVFRGSRRIRTPNLRNSP